MLRRRTERVPFHRYENKGESKGENKGGARKGCLRSETELGGFPLLVLN